MDCIVDKRDAYKHDFLAHRKLAAALPDFDCYHTIEGILFLSSCYFDSSWWATLGFDIKRFIVWYALCVVVAFRDGMYRDGRTV